MDKVMIETTALDRLEAENRELRAMVERLEAELANAARENVALVTRFAKEREACSNWKADADQYRSERDELQADLAAFRRVVRIVGEAPVESEANQ